MSYCSTCSYGSSQGRANKLSYDSPKGAYSASPGLPRGICRRTCITMGKCTCKD